MNRCEILCWTKENLDSEEQKEISSYSWNRKGHIKVEENIGE